MNSGPYRVAQSARPNNKASYAGKIKVSVSAIALSVLSRRAIW